MEIPHLNEALERGKLFLMEFLAEMDFQGHNVGGKRSSVHRPIVDELTAGLVEMTSTRKCPI